MALANPTAKVAFWHDPSLPPFSCLSQVIALMYFDGLAENYASYEQSSVHLCLLVRETNLSLWVSPVRAIFLLVILAFELAETSKVRLSRSAGLPHSVIPRMGSFSS